MLPKNHRLMNVQTEKTGMINGVPAIRMTCVVKYYAYIRKKMEVIVFPMEIFSQRARRKHGLKFMSWVTAIHGDLRLIVKPGGSTGAKWVLMPTKTRKPHVWEWMNSTRPAVPDFSDGHILSVRTWHIPCTTI